MSFVGAADELIHGFIQEYLPSTHALAGHALGSAGVRVRSSAIGEARRCLLHCRRD